MNREAVTRMGWWLATAAMGMLVTVAHADTPAVEFGRLSPNPPMNFTGTRGWGFGYSLALSGPLAITQLGVFDSGDDGLMNAHQVGLWSSDGSLLASVTVPAGTDTPLVGGYRFASISPLVLPPQNGFYIVGVQFSINDPDDLVAPLPGIRNPPIFIDRPLGFFGLGANLPFPGMQTTEPCPDCGSPALWEANFQFVTVPEPSSLWLCAAGVLGWWLWRRKFQFTRRNSR